MPTTKIVATVTWDHGRADGVPALNPGEYWGRYFVLTTNVGYAQSHCVVEADNIGDAIDILADDESHRDWIVIPPCDYGDYGRDVCAGDAIPEGNLGADGAELSVAPRDGWVDLRGTYHAGRGSFGDPDFHGNASVPCDTSELAVDQAGERGLAVRYFGAYEGEELPADGVDPADLDGWAERRRTRNAMLGDAARPGKFEGEDILALLAWDMAMDGHGSPACSPCGESATLLEGPFDLPDTVELTDEETRTLSTSAGCILWQSSDGFVSAEWIRDQPALSQRWADVESALEGEGEEG